MLMNQLTVSLWGDEAFSALIAQKDIPAIIFTAARDTAPPLYYILLHFWIQLFGSSEVALRSLSVMLFLSTGVVVYFFIKSILGKKSATYVAILTLCNPFLFQYAFEARMYMLLVLASVLSFWFFVRERWRAYVVATVAALYTHHFAFFIIMVQVVYYFGNASIVVIRKRKRFAVFFSEQVRSPFLFALTVVLLLYIPWLPVFISQSTRVSGDFWLGKPTVSQLFTVLSNFAAGTVKLSISLLLIGVSLLLLVVRKFQQKTDTLFYCWFFLPLLVTFALSQAGRPIFFDRYLIISVPALTILLASQFPTVKSRSGAHTYAAFFRLLIKKYFYIEICLVLLIIGLAATDVHFFTHPDKQPFRELSRFIQSDVGKQSPVITYYTDQLHYFELRYYHIPVKIYSPSPLPFWVGTALIDPRDELSVLPHDTTLYIMASGALQKIAVPGYRLTRQYKFNELYFFVYQREFNPSF